MTKTQIAKFTSDIKRANQRLRELEKQGLTSSPSYRAIETFLIDKRSFVTVTKKGAVKFRTDLKKIQKDPDAFRELQKNVKKFLESKTSTTKGVKATYKKSYERYKEKTGHNVSYNDFVSIWDNAITQHLLGSIGSTQIIKIYKESDSNGLTVEETNQIIEKYIENNEKNISFEGIREHINDRQDDNWLNNEDDDNDDVPWL